MTAVIVIGLILYFISSILICYFGMKYLDISIVIMTCLFTVIIVNVFTTNILISLVSGLIVSGLLFLLRKVFIFLMMFVVALLLGVLAANTIGFDGNVYYISSFIIGIVIFIFFCKIRKFVYIFVTAYIGASGIAMCISLVMLLIRLNIELSMDSILSLIHSIFSSHDSYKTIVLICFISGVITQITLYFIKKRKKEIENEITLG